MCDSLFITECWPEVCTSHASPKLGATNLPTERTPGEIVAQSACRTTDPGTGGQPPLQQMIGN